MKTEIPRLDFCCPEKWSNMTASGNGRFCGKCEKVVTDFSAMTNEEILQKINLPQVENSCGRFHAHQLEKPFGDKRDSFVKFYQQIISLPKKKNFSRSIQLGLAVILLFITGCYRRTMGMYATPSHHQMKKYEREEKHYYDSVNPDQKEKRRLRTTF